MQWSTLLTYFSHQSLFRAQNLHLVLAQNLYLVLAQNLYLVLAQNESLEREAWLGSSKS